MAENLMNADHKATNKPFRDRYDNIKWVDYTKKDKDQESNENR